MTIQLAREILTRLGGGRVVHVGGTDDTLVKELRLGGCEAWTGAEAPAPEAGEVLDVLVIELPVHDPAGFTRAILERRAAENLVLLGGGLPRKEVENPLFDTGWRRHPAGMLTHEYEPLDDWRLAPVSYYQRIPQAAAARWHVGDLMEDRGLHMDMLRESGCRADAHIVRYSLAAQYIRAGDNVLDCACGLGYGTAVLAALSPGAQFLGMDLDPLTADYAQANYGREGVRYLPGDVAVLDGVPDRSIDVIVSMETLEHVPDWEGALAAFKRVLKPDGRIVTSVPDRWMDETGEDPNEYHLHVFDWAKLANGISQHFILEAKYIQAAPGGFKIPESGRVLRRTDLAGDDGSEWLLAVAAGNPFECDEAMAAEFRHPAFGPDGGETPTLVDFAGSYDNPYLYRSLIQMGERLTDDDKLIRVALMVAQNARADSPDRGGAIAVLGYRVLEARGTGAVPEAMDFIDDFLAASAHSQDPHVLRWRLSLEFLAAKLMEMSGNRDAALDWYGRAASRDWRFFSPLLATKVVAASFYEGRLRLYAGDEDAARVCFSRGMREALAAAASPPEQIVGDLDKPLPFGMQELAEVIDMGGQCASALANLPLWRRSPGLFWSRIDTRRFGLATWAKDLEQENQRLRAAA